MGNSQITLSFASISGRKIEADFDGGTTTSDGGALLLRQAESKIGIVDRIVGALCDRRHQSSIDHIYIDLIKQRVFQIACGYEDANDSNDLRSDPGLKAACQRLPLTGDDLVGLSDSFLEPVAVPALHLFAERSRRRFEGVVHEPLGIARSVVSRPCSFAVPRDFVRQRHAPSRNRRNPLPV